MSRNQIMKSTSALQSTQLDYFLVDGSGSMSGKWAETVAAIWAFKKVLDAQNIHSHGIIQVFDGTDIDFIQRDGLLRDWEIDMLSLYGGGTPLYDSINLMMRRLAELDPPRASIVIVTDGDENASRYTSGAEANALLDWARDKGWQVTFLGADFNNTRQARILGAEAHNTLAVQRTKLIEAGEKLGEKRVENARTGRDINFTESERSEFGGYLTHQK